MGRDISREKKDEKKHLASWRREKEKEREKGNRRESEVRWQSVRAAVG